MPSPERGYRADNPFSSHAAPRIQTMSTAVASDLALRDLAVERRCRSPWVARAILFVLALEVFYFTGVVASDDFQYVTVARMAQAGQPVPASLYYLSGRFVHWRLVQLCLWLFPHWPSAIALPSLAASLGLLVVLWLLSRGVIGASMAMLPVLICGLTPVCVAVASVAIPDALATALGWAGVWMAAAPLLERRTPHSGWRCVLGGLLIGLGYSAKESTALLVPGLLLFVLLFRGRCAWAWKRGACLAVGALLWAAGEAVATTWLYGDPLARMHAIAAGYQVFGGAEVAPGWRGFLLYATQYLRWLADVRSEFGTMGPIMLAGLVYGLLSHSSAAHLLVCVVMPGLIYVSLGSTELHSYRPVVHQPRYLMVVLPGFALLAAMLVHALWKGALWRRRLIFGTSLVLVAASVIAPNKLAGRWYHAQTFAAGYELIAEKTPRLPADARLLASGLSCNRFQGLPHWLDCPPVERIWPTPPRTRADWIDRYAGAYVIVTRADRLGPGRPKHDHLALSGEPMAALSTFELVARCEPPRDRLSTLWARLRGQQVPTNPEQAVELWRVPLADE